MIDILLTHRNELDCTYFNEYLNTGRNYKITLGRQLVYLTALNMIAISSSSDYINFCW